MDEVPLLRASATYVQRLCSAANQFDDSRYRFAQRVNWSHKYSEQYYQSECAIFLNRPDQYFEGTLRETSQLDDIFQIRIARNAILRIFFKVLLHRTFSLAGKLQRIFWHRRRSATYRKAYVDDIELVFDDAAPADRFVYPFPISAKRQIKYIFWLLKTKRRFCFAGHEYLLADLVNLLRKRDFASLLRLESRAQLRHAGSILKQGYRKIELSDEFDLGSLEFCRRLARANVIVENGAHGVGKYLPFHKYDLFRAITDRQIEYYRSIRSCTYTKVNLRLRNVDDLQNDGRAGCSLVFVSQISKGISSIVSEAEAELLPILSELFGDSDNTRLFYRPHPNQQQIIDIPGFERSSDFEEYGPGQNIVYLSFYSTTHIDPNFRGESYLISTKYIRPDEVFDDNSSILHISELPRRLGRIVLSKNASSASERIALSK